MKTESRFFCQNCGNDFPRWSGQCQSCGAWNSLVEEKTVKAKQTVYKPKHAELNTTPLSIKDIDYNQEERKSSGVEEFDRVLGGGIVPGAVILVGGDPGIGKSTLMLQIANKSDKKILYASGEESAKQIKIRAQRLGALSEKIKVYAETNLFLIEKGIEQEKPEIVIIDSIQTMFREDIDSAPGSVSQVRECAAYLVKIAKETHIPIFIIGHVTKEGNIAGPRILEHIVDAVIYFEGEQHKQFRILRGIKNRFGSISEVGIFEMTETGLVTVDNPSEIFLAERPKGESGSTITAIIEGSRPLLIEVQALTAYTKMVMPRRTSVGIDYNRLMMILAVLEKKANLKLSSLDIFVSIAGGIKVAEPAIDLPMALAVASSYKNKPLPEDLIAVGEIGLTGEVRAVNQIEKRITEAEKLGFKKILIPKGNLKQIKTSKIEIAVAGSISEAFNNIGTVEK
ncbi:DNA repair protein RadA [candidate division WOR-1 bacterium RIFOXYA2_FULL_36_21]|uniref:DNA repair protein RadA n=1 Tax=candidate division WOR-1 bacterium RIFOXYB2_FULL_36_35 TaxID=1802578 RepID=A0A1F4S2S9_UNCSA|nr:MAG: DNA repair protein RadA [candidate division WOR-1 bacterium RIFOXYA2_FULL_36_21]OGC14766.1 MAG: DNA repair protein RadA [candidate division WOR-1 bacterium RIFOXYB2_FULL_36_35]OGC15449.1 MAG: DNA repair protein RadA [candidate division WOR-1 bacterium RIFOXYA12_FULL_36_13]